MLDELDDNDPVWVRVRAARPIAPVAIARSLEARLPVRRRPAANVAIALAIATVAGALVIAIMGRGTPPAPQQVAGTQTGSSTAVGHDARLADAMQADAPPVDANARARELVEALHGGDVKGASAMLRLPLVHRGCSKQDAASTADAARQVATCIARLEVVKHGQIKDVRPSTIEDVLHAAAYDRRHAQGVDLRALQADHAFVAITLSTRREPYHREGYEAATIYVAIDHADLVGAIVVGPVKIVD